MTRAPLLLLYTLAGCGPAQIIGPRDTGLDGLELVRIDPGLILPGTRMVIGGHSFVDGELGATRLHLAGTAAGAPLDASFDVTFVSSSQLELTADDSFVAALGGALAGTLDGNATVEIGSTVDHRLHSSAPLAVKLALATDSTPSLAAVGDGVSFVNQPVAVAGTGFLLGGTEGETHALLSGCFTPTGKSACGPNVHARRYPRSRPPPSIARASPSRT